MPAWRPVSRRELVATLRRLGREACGHVPPLERPGEFVEAVAGFLG